MRGWSGLFSSEEAIAEEVLCKFEEFLSSIPLIRYRDELLNVKTVEQDLPKSLNPLPAIYEKYWTDRVQEFPSYDKFFSDWWESNLSHIDKFVQKYCWGCSWKFVEERVQSKDLKNLCLCANAVPFLLLLAYQLPISLKSKLGTRHERYRCNNRDRSSVGSFADKEGNLSCRGKSR